MPISKQVFSRWVSALILAVALCSALLVPEAVASNPVNVSLRSGPSNPIYVDAGPVTINFFATLYYAGRGNPDQLQTNASVLIYDESGEQLATVQVSGGKDLLPGSVPRLGTVTWNNPVAQYIELSGDFYIVAYGPNLLEWWYTPAGRSVASGGDTPPSGSGISNPPVHPTPPQTAASRPNANIHAVVISGLGDPAKIIASPNVTLTGGIVALGRDRSPLLTTSSWSPGLRVLPDYDLLTGAKIPPVTPNIIDVRIVRQQVQADFPSPGQHPGD